MIATELAIGPARVHFTDRHGGVSVPPYASANVGVHVGDAPDAVAENRRLLASALGDAVNTWVWLHQVHGDAVLVVDSASGVVPAAPVADAAVTARPGTALCASGVVPAAPVADAAVTARPGTALSASGVVPAAPVADAAVTARPGTALCASGVVPAAPVADAAVTARPGTALCVQVADCAPIALIGTRAVGVVHAGWPGLEAGVIANAVDALRAQDPSPAPGPVRAVLGPCIHPGRYEFGADDLARLVEHFGPSVATTTDWGTPAFDIPTAVRLELTRAGVDDVLDLDVCTSQSPDHFSYRRDGLTGRQALVAVLEP